jgi:cytosine/adenosine deaminase-related metal-dependent hydrolase
MRILDATVTRRSRSGDIIGPAQRVDVLTALKAMTIWPAWHKHEDASKGSIEVGKLADFVILSADPTAVDPETLDQIEVLETIKEGATVFELTADEQRRATLMVRPDREGESALGRFVLAASYSAHGAGGEGPHGSSCACDFMSQLAATLASDRETGLQ